MYKFSIIIPVYNSEKYLDRCILSCINQTYKNFEIILIDDGSSDNSLKICNKYKNIDNRINVIHNKNEGVSIARNIGIENSEGKYIVFVDSDDFIEQDMLEKLENLLNKQKTECIIYNLDNMLKSKAVYGEEINNILIKLIISEVINSPCNKVYIRDIIEKNNIRFEKNVKIGEDLLFNVLYISKIKGFYLLNENFYNYSKENKQSLTLKYNKDKYNELMLVNKKLRGYFKKYNNKKILECEKYLRLKNIFSCFMDLSRDECKYSHNEKIEFVSDVKKENKIIIRRLGLKLYLLSLIYTFLPNDILLEISKIAYTKKHKLRRRKNNEKSNNI